MPLEATTNALKSSRCAAIITQDKHKFSSNTNFFFFIISVVKLHVSILNTDYH